MNSGRDDIEAGTGRSARSRRALVTVTVLALAGIALYAAAGFWIAPRIVEHELRTMARDEAGLDLTLETVAVNPFTLALSLHNVTLFLDENTPVASIGRLEGRIRGIGLEVRSLTLGEVAVGSLSVADRRGRPVLAAPAVTAASLVIGSQAAIATEAAHLDQPHLQVHAGTGGSGLTETLSYLLGMASGIGDGGVSLTITGGSLELTGRASTAVARIRDIDGSITRRSTPQDVVANASLRSDTPAGGSAGLTAEWLLHRPRQKSRLELALRRFDGSFASAWLTSTLGRDIEANRIDLDLALAIERSLLDLDVEAAVEDIGLGPPAERAGPSASPLEAALALLADADGRATLDVSAERRLRAGMEVVDVFSRSLKDRVATLAASPFEYLADVVDWTGTSLGSLAFQPGRAEPGDETAAKIAALERALALRPRLALTVFPALEENADREALARQQIRLHVNLASSAGIPGEPVPEALEYDDPVVRDVLDEFATNRLEASRREALAARHPGRNAVYYRAVFEALVDNEEVTMPTLIRLARYRAQAVIDALAAGERGGRVRQAEEIVLAAPGEAPEVTLEVRYTGN